MSPFVRPWSVRRGDRILARAVFLIVLAVYTATFAGRPDNPDAEVEFQTVHALYEHHTLALGGTPEADLIVQQRFDVHEGAGEHAGEFYSWFGVGQALTGLPFFAAGRLLARAFPEIEAGREDASAYGVRRSEYFEHLVVGWRNPLLGALTAWLVLIAARRVGASRPSAFVAALGYALCTYAWPQARSTLSDVQASFLLFLALALVLRFRETFQRHDRPRLALVLLLGAALGLAFLTRLVTAPAVGVVFALLATVLVSGARGPGGSGRRLLELGLAAAPALACFVLFLVLNQRRFGHPLESGYGASVGAAYFGNPVWIGLAGLFLSPGRGLLWFAPPVLLALPGARRAWQRGGSFLPLAVLVLSASLVLPFAMIEAWAGGWTYGPRYVLPLVPVLFLLVAHGLDLLARRRAGRLVAAALFGLGFLVSIAGVLVDSTTHLDLAMQAERLAWPDPPGATPEQDENLRFDRLQWEWRYAAPWAHWRILRHRIAGLGEEFPVRELYFLDRDETVAPTQEASRDLNHLAWVDLARRIGHRPLGVWAALGLLLLAGIASAVRGFDPTLR